MYTLYTDCIEQERTEACVVQAGSGRLLSNCFVVLLTIFRVSLLAVLTFSCCLVKSMALAMPYVGVIVL